MSGSDFPEGKDWVRAENGRWYPPGGPVEKPTEQVGTQYGGPIGWFQSLSGGAKLAVVIALGLVIAFIFERPDQPESSVPARPSLDELAVGARDVCHQFVEERLRAPATAGFENRSEARTTVSGGVHTVVGHVDSENGFGALVRSDYVCMVRHTGGANFQLVSLTGLE